MPVCYCSYLWNYLTDQLCHKFWRPNAQTVCEDEDYVKGKIAIVTGSNCGVGKEIATQLARRGVVVILAVRDVEKGAKAKSEIEREHPGCAVDVKHLDLANMKVIEGFVADFEAEYPRLNLLVNNAGVMSSKKERQLTDDGFELQVGVNHLGTFLLTYLLLGSLTRGEPSRVVTLASTNLAIAKLDLDDFMMEGKPKRGDHGREQYNMSKLAIALSIRQLVRVLYETGVITPSQVRFFTMCPGFVKSELFRQDKGCRRCCVSMQLGMVGLSPHSGAETACYLCLSQSVYRAKNSGRGEIYRFMKIWKLGEKILTEVEGSEEISKLFELTTRYLALDRDDDDEPKRVSVELDDGDQEKLEESLDLTQPKEKPLLPMVQFSQHSMHIKQGSRQATRSRDGSFHFWFSNKGRKSPAAPSYY